MLYADITDQDFDYSPVLLVVRVEFDFNKVHRLKERINWLEGNIFPFPHFQNRSLILFSSSAPLLAKSLDSLYAWTLYEDYNDVYTKIMNRSFLVGLPEHDQYFQSAVFLNIRDDGKVGMAWGLREGYHERCIIRAMFLQAKGNVLFGDWGWAGSTPPDYDPVVLKRQLSIPDYWYVRKGLHVMQNTEEHRHVNTPFIRVLDHFLRPQYASDETLSEENMDKIKRMKEDKLFDGPAKKRALWSAHHDLLFPQDYYCLDYHRWHTSLRLIQVILIQAYVRFRMWFASSTWVELGVDLAIFALWSVFFAVVSFVIQNNEHFIRFVPTAPLSFQPLRFVGWYVFHFMIYLEHYPPDDRPTFRERFMEMKRVGFIASWMEPFVVFVASRMTWTSAAMSLLLGGVDYLAISQMDWLMWHRDPESNWYTFGLATLVCLLLFGQRGLEAAPSVVEFHVIWFQLLLTIGYRWNRRNFLHLYELTWHFVRSFVIAPAVCAVILCGVKFVWSYLS